MVPGIENQIWPLVARGVENVARKNNYTVLLCNTDDDVEPKNAIWCVCAANGWMVSL